MPLASPQASYGHLNGGPEYKLFRTFVKRVWKHLNLPAPTPVQDDLADYLQFGGSRIIIQAFRGVGKSWITAAFVVWNLYRDPQKKVLIVSASKEYADTQSTFIKRLIDELPECAFLKPQTHQRNSQVQFDVGPATADKSPSVKSVGITGQITGSRADIIVADDVETPKNSFTALMRERLADLVKEFAYVIKPELIDGERVPTDKIPRIIYLGTPQTEMSLYNVLSKERGYETRIWPARVPAKLATYKGNLAPFVVRLIEEKGLKAGAPIDPKRFNDADLMGRQADVGRSSFALQYQMDTSLSDGLKYPLKLSDLIVMSLDAEKAPVALSWARSPETQIADLSHVGFSGDGYYRPAFVDKDYADFQGSVMAIDPSGKGQDETAWAIVKMLHGKLYLVASGGLKGGYEVETLRALGQAAKQYKVNEIIIEENYGDGMFGALFKPVLRSIWPCTVTSIKHTRATGSKEQRMIDTLEPVFNSHKLVVDRSVIEEDLKVDSPVYSLFYQMTRLTKDAGALAHDDRLDALAMAVGYWLSQMAVDEKEAAESHRDAELEDALERFSEEMNTADMLGHNGGPPLDDMPIRRRESWTGA